MVGKKDIIVAILFVAAGAALWVFYIWSILKD